MPLFTQGLVVFSSHVECMYFRRFWQKISAHVSIFENKLDIFFGLVDLKKHKTIRSEQNQY